MRTRLAALVLALLASVPPRAAATAPSLMPIDPEIVQRYRAAGRDVPHAMTEERFATRPGLHVNRVENPMGAAAGPLRAIVLLVRFTDSPPGGPAVRFAPAVWDSLLFGAAYLRGGADTTTGRTLKNFLAEVSYGAVDVVTLDLPGATGWLPAPNDYAYYCQHDGVHDNGFGPYPHNVQRLVMDAVLAADPLVDFSRYAVGGVVQNLFVVHAGSGAEWSGGGDLIWSHAWDITSDDGHGHTPPALYVDGVRVSGYSMEPEAGGDTNGESGPAMAPMLPTVGVYAHEFGHVLGLPDEYDYGYESQGTGRMSLMAGGSWNRHPDVYPDCAGNAPAHPSAWGIAHLGFVAPTLITATTAGIVLPPIEATRTGALCRVNSPGTDGKEYWLFENRQQLGFDQGLARMGASAHGLLVYHVDENVLARTYWLPNEAECVSGGAYAGATNCDCAALPANPSNGEKWYGIAIEQADGLYQMERGASGGDGGDFYSAITGRTTFDATSSPNTSSYYGCAGVVAATAIHETGGNIVLDLTPDAAAPAVRVLAPDGGEALAVGAVADLRWEATDNAAVTSVDLLLARAGLAGPCDTLAAGIANTGTFAWTVTGPATVDAWLRVVAHDAAGNAGEDASAASFTISAATATGAAADRLTLSAARPMPLRGQGRLEFALPRAAVVRLGIYDLRGREVARLVDGERAAGHHAMTWETGAGRGVPAGLYFLVLHAEGRALTQRLVVLD